MIEGKVGNRWDKRSNKGQSILWRPLEVMVGSWVFFPEWDKKLLEGSESRSDSCFNRRIPMASRQTIGCVWAKGSFQAFLGLYLHNSNLCLRNHMVFLLGFCVHIFLFLSQSSSNPVLHNQPCFLNQNKDMRSDKCTYGENRTLYPWDRNWESWSQITL